MSFFYYFQINFLLLFKFLASHPPTVPYPISWITSFLSVLFYMQFIVVSLKEGMFNNANVLFRTKFVDGVSTVQRTVAKQNKWYIVLISLHLLSCSSFGKIDMKMMPAIECLCILNIIVGLICHGILLIFIHSMKWTS
jgi:hypothetical protein